MWMIMCRFLSAKDAKTYGRPASAHRLHDRTHNTTAARQAAQQLMQHLHEHDDNKVNLFEKIIIPSLSYLSKSAKIQGNGCLQHTHKDFIRVAVCSRCV